MSTQPAVTTATPLSSTAIRERLIETLRLDLVGPNNDHEFAEELLPEPPTRWYLTGYLVPTGAPIEQKFDETSTEEIDSASDVGATDDGNEPDRGPARRSLLPSSMGLSVLVPAGVRQLKALVEWGDYQYEGPGEEMSAETTEDPAETHAGNRIVEQLAGLAARGWQGEQFAALAESIATARLQSTASSSECDLVLSGPEATGIPTRDTAAVMHALLAEARQEVLLVGYAFHKAQALFQPLAERLAAGQNLRVWLCVDISRKSTDTSLSSEIVRRFTAKFWSQHWPWTPRPELYYDSRSLETTVGGRSCLHAKCIVVDRAAALITSANFTEAAQHRNIECGCDCPERRVLPAHCRIL